MSLAVCLLLYAFVVVVIGPLLLVRLTRRSVAPRLGMASSIGRRYIKSALSAPVEGISQAATQAG